MPILDDDRSANGHDFSEEQLTRARDYFLELTEETNRLHTLYMGRLRIEWPELSDDALTELWTYRATWPGSTHEEWPV